MKMNPVPSIRIRKTNDNRINPDGDFVLYWMIAYRRSHWNYSLQRAVEWALKLKKPLVILEALRCDYPWASDRFHAFLLDGMAENAKYFQKCNVTYYPYIETKPDAGKGLLDNLSDRACAVVTDDFPAYFIPHMIRSASRKVPVLMEAVDANGILPMRTAEKVFLTAYSFRRFLQKHLPEYLHEAPGAEPLKNFPLTPFHHFHESIRRTWPSASKDMLEARGRTLSSFPIDHHVKPVKQKGGALKGRRVLNAFVRERLFQYAEKRNLPEEHGTSGLSAYIHFGHISVHEIFRKVMAAEAWSFDRLSAKTSGSKSGWWGVDESTEAFLDQLITWRELGFNMCRQRDDYDRYASLPDWARASLKAHAMDKRAYVYTPEEFEKGQTHDTLWNAAQSQLVREGTIHNYLRMLWGKKILEWSPKPAIALDIMIELNNKYALDGRDPNSYSGIFWILGRYDRPWGPERPVLGKIRYMSSKNTARKFPVKGYIKKYTLA